MSARMMGGGPVGTVIVGGIALGYAAYNCGPRTIVNLIGSGYYASKACSNKVNEVLQNTKLNHTQDESKRKEIEERLSKIKADKENNKNLSKDWLRNAKPFRELYDSSNGSKSTKEKTETELPSKTLTDERKKELLAISEEEANNLEQNEQVK